MSLKKSLNTSESIAWFRDGNILAHPTEGVWGLGCNALDSSAYTRLFLLKKRDTKKSFILLCRSLQSMKKYILNLSLSDESLLNNTWPGPVTFVIKYNSSIPEHLKNDTGKLAFRVSNHYPIKALLKDLIKTAQTLSHFGPKLPSLLENLLTANIEKETTHKKSNVKNKLTWAFIGSASTTLILIILNHF